MNNMTKKILQYAQQNEQFIVANASNGLLVGNIASHHDETMEKECRDAIQELLSLSLIQLIYESVSSSSKTYAITEQGKSFDVQDTQ